MKPSILSTDGILFISWHVHQWQMLCWSSMWMTWWQVWLDDLYHPKHSTGNINRPTIKMFTINQTRGNGYRAASKHAWQSIAFMPLVICNFRHGLLWCFSMTLWCILASGQLKWFMVSTPIYMSELSKWELSLIIAGACFPCFLFHIVFCSTWCFFERRSIKLHVCVYFYLKHQSESRSEDNLRPAFVWIHLLVCDRCNPTPRHHQELPDDLRGVGIARFFFVRFRLFAMFRFHVISLIWWIISGSSLPRNIYFDSGYRLSNRTESRKNRATALFGLNIDNFNS